MLGGVVNIARREDDRRLELRALTLWSQMAMFGLHEQDRGEKSRQALRVLESVDSPWDEVLVHSVALLDLWNDGDLRGAKGQAEACLAAAERLGDSQLMSTAYSMSQGLAQTGGDWSAARDYGLAALGIWPERTNPLAHMALLECELGEFGAAESYLVRLLEPEHEVQDQGSMKALVISLVGRTRGDSLRFEMGKTICRQVLASPRNALAEVTGRMALALIAVEEGDVTVAREQYPILEARCAGSRGWSCGQAVERILGLVAQGAGLVEEAANHFEDALSFCRDGGCLPQLAWTCCDYADLLLERGCVGDRKQAMSLLDEGLAISRDLGMRPSKERILARRRTLEG
jgi:tetratricopeptide (TPR) repeat protein